MSGTFPAHDLELVPPVGAERVGGGDRFDGLARIVDGVLAESIGTNVRDLPQGVPPGGVKLRREREQTENQTKEEDRGTAESIGVSHGRPPRQNTLYLYRHFVAFGSPEVPRQSALSCR